MIDLHGELIRLRTTSAADSSRLVEIRETDEVRRRFRSDDVAAEIAADLDDEELHQLSIEADGKVVGLIQFYEELDEDYRHASIDLYIDPAAHRRGFASTALTMLTDYLFDEVGHHRITIDPAADNDAAIACYAGVGFQTVGVMRAYERQHDGSWGDGLLMDLLATERTGKQ